VKWIRPNLREQDILIELGSRLPRRIQLLTAEIRNEKMRISPGGRTEAPTD
jgi:hypothetical protein